MRSLFCVLLFYRQSSHRYTTTDIFFSTFHSHDESKKQEENHTCAPKSNKVPKRKTRKGLTKIETFIV